MKRKQCFCRHRFTQESLQINLRLKLPSYLSRIMEKILVRSVRVGWSTFICSLKSDMFRSKICYLYCKIENQVLPSEKPGFVGSISVGSYGFSCRRKTGGHALGIDPSLHLRRSLETPVNQAAHHISSGISTTSIKGSSMSHIRDPYSTR